MAREQRTRIYKNLFNKENKSTEHHYVRRGTQALALHHIDDIEILNKKNQIISSGLEAVDGTLFELEYY